MHHVPQDIRHVAEAGCSGARGEGGLYGRGYPRCVKTPVEMVETLPFFVVVIDASPPLALREEAIVIVRVVLTA